MGEGEDIRLARPGLRQRRLTPLRPGSLPVDVGCEPVASERDHLLRLTSLVEQVARALNDLKSRPRLASVPRRCNWTPTLLDRDCRQSTTSARAHRTTLRRRRGRG